MTLPARAARHVAPKRGFGARVLSYALRFPFLVGASLGIATATVAYSMLGAVSRAW